MDLRKANRKQAKIKLALQGPSGSGKTYSALLLASGITDYSKIAIIEKESEAPIFLFVTTSFFCPFPILSPYIALDKKVMAAKIRRSLLLREYDVKETPEGKQTTFSIKFIKKNGEIVFIPNAVACGLTANMSKNSLRGVLSVDATGNKIGHPTPVSIDAIIEWNSMQVIL